MNALPFPGPALVADDRSAVPVDQALDDREEAEAEPAAQRVALAIALHERLEDPLELVAGDAPAVVANGHPHAIGVELHPDLESPVRRSELGGVGQEVSEHLREADRVAEEGDVAGDVDLEVRWR